MPSVKNPLFEIASRAMAESWDARRLEQGILALVTSLTTGDIEMGIAAIGDPEVSETVVETLTMIVEYLLAHLSPELRGPLTVGLAFAWTERGGTASPPDYSRARRYIFAAIPLIPENHTVTPLMMELAVVTGCIASSRDRASVLMNVLKNSQDAGEVLGRCLTAFDEAVLGILSGWGSEARHRGDLTLAEHIEVVASLVGFLKTIPEMVTDVKIASLLLFDSPGSFREWLDRKPELASQSHVEALEKYIESARRSGSISAASRGGRLLAQLVELRREKQLDAALADLIESPSWSAALDRIRKDPLLLTVDAIDRLNAWLQRATDEGDEDAVNNLVGHKSRISACLVGRQRSLVKIAEAAITESWDETLILLSLMAWNQDLSIRDIASAAEALADSRTPPDVASSIERLVGMVADMLEGDPIAGEFHLLIGAAWLNRAAAGNSECYERARLQCVAAQSLIPSGYIASPFVASIDAAAARLGRRDSDELTMMMFASHAMNPTFDSLFRGWIGTDPDYLRALRLVLEVRGVDDQVGYVRTHLKELDGSVVHALILVSGAAAHDSDADDDVQGGRVVTSVSDQIMWLATVIQQLRQEPNLPSLERAQHFVDLLEAPDDRALLKVLDQWPDALDAPMHLRLVRLKSEAEASGDAGGVKRYQRAIDRLLALARQRSFVAGHIEFLAISQEEQRLRYFLESPPLHTDHAVAEIEQEAKAAERTGDVEKVRACKCYLRWVRAERSEIHSLAEKVAREQLPLIRAIQKLQVPSPVENVDEDLLWALGELAGAYGTIRNETLAAALIKLVVAILPSVMKERPKRARFALTAGRILRETGHLTDAHGQISHALGIFESVHDAAGWTAASSELARIHFARGEVEPAIARAEATIREANLRGDAATEAEARMILAGVHIKFHRHDEAVRELQKAEETARAGGARTRQAEALAYLGDIYELQGELREAREYYLSAVDLARENNTPWQEAHLHIGIGEVAESLGDLDEAETHYNEARRLYHAGGDRRGQARVFCALGDLATARKDHSGALQAYETGYSLYQSLEDRDGQAFAVTLRGNLRMATREPGLALADFMIARNLRKATADRTGEAQSLLAMGLCQERLGRAVDARALYEQSLGIFDGLKDLHGRGRALVAIARLFREQSAAERAHEAYREALEAFEQVRGEQYRPHTRRTVLALAARPYREMVDLCLELDRPAEALHWAERSKARSLLDLLGSAPPRLNDDESRQLYGKWRETSEELFALEAAPQEATFSILPFTQATGMAAEDLRAGRIAQLREREATLRAQVLAMVDNARDLIQVAVPQPPDLINALVELARVKGASDVSGSPAPPPRKPLVVEFFWLGARRFVVFLIPLWQQSHAAGTVLHRTFKADRHWLELVTRLLPLALSAASQAATDEPDYVRESRERVFSAWPSALGYAFFEPWGDLLEDLDPTELLFIPHSITSVVPLHAAELPSGMSLIDRYQVAYLPSAAMARLLVAQAPSDRRPECRLLMGPFDSSLPEGVNEAWEISAMWNLPAGPEFLGDQMRIDALRQRGGKAEVIHLITHSKYVARDYLRSYIQFSGETLTLADLISDSHFDFRGNRLFYLDSCEGALSPAEENDELPGLIWALFYAGAGAVMASLWSVDDRSSKEMAVSFYRYLDTHPEASLAEAYQAAVLHVKKLFPNPYFWSPFVLSGKAFVALD